MFGLLYFRIFITRSIEDVEDFFTERIGMLKDQYGVLLLLYTVMCTKGASEICLEMLEIEPMIDSTYGYGSQNLINLMLTGRAVSHVWDHDQDISGLSEMAVLFFFKYNIIFYVSLNVCTSCSSALIHYISYILQNYVG